jgi:N-acylneuraminate cytidylyltransferase
MYTLSDNAQMTPILTSASNLRRQDLPPVYVLNGAIYVANIPWLRASQCFVTIETVAYKMPAMRSIDLDTKQDFRQLQSELEEM